MELKYYHSFEKSMDTLPQTKLLTSKQLATYHNILSEINYKRKMLFADRLRFINKKINVQSQDVFFQ